MYIWVPIHRYGHTQIGFHRHRTGQKAVNNTKQYPEKESKNLSNSIHCNDFQESNRNPTTEVTLTDPIVGTTDHTEQSNQFNASGIHPDQLNQDLNGNIKRIPDHIWSTESPLSGLRKLFGTIW